SGTIILEAPLPEITDPAGLVIDGSGQSVTVSGNQTVRPFTIVAGASLDLRYLVVTEGLNGGSAGGGIRNEGMLSIANSTLSHNHAGPSFSSGGGIYNSGTLIIRDSTISDNRVGSRGNALGGGIYNSGTLTISNSTI